ncbi:MAG: glycosyltransferase [Anaerolineae bacterium]
MKDGPQSTPLVSVILPTFNRAGLLSRAIRSVLDQTYRHWELIVVDDASTDGTSQVVASFGDPRLYYVRLPINCGHPSRPRNIGWTLARGVYVAYIDDDNAWRPHHLARLVAAAQAKPGAAGAYGGRCHHLPDGSTEDIVDPNHGIDTGDGMHRRDLVTLMPEMWTETNFTNEDIEFWARLRQRHPVGLAWVPEVLSDYYIHDGNRFNTHWLNFRRYDHDYYLGNAAWLDDSCRWQRYVDAVTRLDARHVLDVGCGRGWVVEALRRRGIDAWGVDPSPFLADLSRIQPYHIRASADRLPFDDGAFDVVLCTDVLAHIPEPFVERSLREMARVCRGYFVAAVDCADPTKPGHTTMRPREWWMARLAAVGLSAAPKMPGGPAADGLELIIVKSLGRTNIVQEFTCTASPSNRSPVSPS